jgi:hypothetical protein
LPSASPSLPSPPPPVPERLVGLWRRHFLQFTDGSIDRTTRVFWGQTKSLYVDIRIPLTRPKTIGRQSLMEFSVSELRLLAEQKGFAGHIVFRGEQCSWIRHIDYRPPTGRPDEARLRINGDTLYEDGDPTAVLGKTYQEVYYRESRADAVCVALKRNGAAQTHVDQARPRDAILILLNDWFLYAQSREDDLPPAETLRELVDRDIADRNKIHAYLDCEFSIGRIAAPNGPWKISLSTLPFRESHAVLRASRALNDGTTLQFCSRETKETTSWEIVESNISSAALAAMFDV